MVRIICTLSLFAVIGMILVVPGCTWFPSARESGYRFVIGWGQQGSEPGQFHDPTGIAVTATEVFVSD